ncbi:dipeptidase 1-like isoform X3 [Portunus trituberculatus]|uniref:dipeptidase 1-like isoform X3 n=1 Tax=Portunus trituberculatus TaxID=210409 RepID=UPI001E1CC741|nr:dipeptidase 1-like isoform X3 [Portunus trituberculatus]
MGRVVVVVVVAAATAAAGCRASPLPVRVSPDAPPQERLQAAHTLLATSPLIDGHNDLAWNVRKFLHNKLHSFNLSSDLTKEKPWRNSRFSHTDLPRLRKGQVAAQFWSVYVPCGAQYLNTVQLLLEQVDTVRRMVAASPHDTVLVRSSSEILEEFRRGRVASLMGVEGGHGLASSMGVVRALYDLGVRYVTLTHKCHTPWAECSEPDPHLPNTRGLTPYGKELVREMNRLGLMVDLSHASARTARDVLNTTRAPVIFSHSAARALCRIERNVPDDVLSSLAENGGIVMISFYNDFLTCSEKASVQDVLTSTMSAAWPAWTTWDWARVTTASTELLEVVSSVAASLGTITYPSAGEAVCWKGRVADLCQASQTTKVTKKRTKVSEIFVSSILTAIAGEK